MVFAPYCPVHGSRVLLFSDNVEMVQNTPKGIHVYYECNCGHHGVWHPGR